MKHLTESDVITLLDSRVRAAGSQSNFAKRHRMSLAYLGDVLKRKRGPGEKILAALGLVKVIIYQQAGGGQ